MITSNSTSPAVEGLVNLEVPLAGLSHCHLGIISQLQEFAEMTARVSAQAVQSRKVATNILALFKFAVYGHHADEENELFPAVLRSATQGEEAERILVMVQRLTAEHREIESCWKNLEPELTAASTAEPGDLDLKGVQDLVRRYMAHAFFEEQQFFPLAETILARNGKPMAAPGLQLC
ncbi:MAG: hemerythrin domain-containing protein [Polaromonas sp.]